GRHHTRDHWSRVWDGERWLQDADAAEFILDLQGDGAGFIPAEAVALGSRQRADNRPRRVLRVRERGSGRAGRLQAYMAPLPHLSAGQGRDDVAYNFAAFLVRDLQLTDDSALAWLKEWDRGNTPPKVEDRLTEILASAHAYGKHAYGSGLGEHHELTTLKFTV